MYTDKTSNSEIEPKETFTTKRDSQIRTLC